MVLRPTGETGVQTHVTELRALLKNTAVQFTVVTPFSSSRYVVSPVFSIRIFLTLFNAGLGIRWYRYWHAHFLARALRKQLLHAGHCIVYAQCPVSAEVALRVRVDSSQEVVMAVHFNRSQADEWAGKGMLKPSSRLFVSIRRFEAELLPRVDRLVFVSGFMHDYLQSAHPLIRNIPTAIIPNFIFRAAQDEVLGHPADLISVGTLEPRKNQQFLIEVVAAAHDLGYRYHLTLVGRGPDRSMLAELAVQKGVEHSVHLVGHIDGARRLLPGHRAYVHAAKAENLGIAILEALAAGLPVFAPPLDGMREVFRDGQEGRFWSLDDPTAAAIQLIELLEDEPAWNRASAAAARRYETTFSPEVVGPRLLVALGIDPTHLL